MKKTLFVAFIALLSMCFTLEAQNNRRDNRQEARPGMRWTAKERAEVMQKQLSLTDDEKTKVEALLEKQDAKRNEQFAEQRAKRDDKVQDRSKLREEMQALREKELAKNDAELEVIIGKEKVEKWKKYREEQQQKMRDANREGSRPPMNRNM